MSKPLSDYQWKNRLILFHLSADASADAFKKQLAEVTPELEDRDLVVLPLDAPLRERFRASTSESTFILIGKDGGEKARQVGSFQPAKFFQLIDSMPMRQAEMREKGR